MRKWHLAGLDTGCCGPSVGDTAHPAIRLAFRSGTTTAPSEVSAAGRESVVAGDCVFSPLQRVSFHAADAVVILACVLLAGCGAKTVPPPQIIREVQTVEVKVPVQVQRTPPAELLIPIAPPLPVFVEPANPEASSALTAEGERLLRGLIEELLTRIEAWRAWAETKE